MKTILDTINEVSTTKKTSSWLPEPKGMDPESKKYVKKYGDLILDLLTYLQKKQSVFWAANGKFDVKSIQVEENTRQATRGDLYLIVSIHDKEKGDFRNELASIILKMDEKTHKVWYVSHHKGAYSDWNNYNYRFDDEIKTTIDFLDDRGMYELKYDLDGKHRELPIPVIR